ncbi:tetratricopeptide repeat protein [Ornithinibacillus sp. 4-3]|uniref:Tetratricopeptide repeat protein n=1 Tax=Ornithinibacillus sp. 4-3 TaxID=3231488 RepID=A0AB39HGP8_9BACI
METILHAIQLLENNQSDQAMNILQQYYLSASDDEKFAICEVYMQWGFLAEANEALQELIDKYPDESELKIMLAQNYVELEDDKAAINILNNIHEEDPAYVQALLQLADLYQAEGLFEVAEMKLMMAKKLQPKESIIDFALGEFFFSTGEFKRAITYYEKVFKQHKEIANISIISRLAEANAASGEYEKALEFYQKVKSNNPNELFKHGLTAFYADRKDIAIKVWGKLLDIDPYYHSVYYELATAYDAEGLIENAYEVCQKGIEFDEHHKELQYFAGVLANKLKDFEASMHYVKKAIELDPDYQEAILFLVELLKEDEQYTEIIDLLEQIQAGDTSDPLYSWELARAYYEEDFIEKAAEQYEDAYMLLEEDPIFLKEYGYFLAEQGKLTEANIAFTKYLQLEPSDEEMKEYVQRLSEI